MNTTIEVSPEWLQVVVEDVLSVDELSKALTRTPPSNPRITNKIENLHLPGLHRPPQYHTPPAPLTFTVPHDTLTPTVNAGYNAAPGSTGPDFPQLATGSKQIPQRYDQRSHKCQPSGRQLVGLPRDTEGPRSTTSPNPHSPPDKVHARPFSHHGAAIQLESTHGAVRKVGGQPAVHHADLQCHHSGQPASNMDHYCALIKGYIIGSNGGLIPVDG